MQANHKRATQKCAFVTSYPSIEDEREAELRSRHAYKVGREIRCPSMMLFGRKDVREKIISDGKCAPNTVGCHVIGLSVTIA